MRRSLRPALCCAAALLVATGAAAPGFAADTVLSTVVNPDFGGTLSRTAPGQPTRVGNAVAGATTTGAQLPAATLQPAAATQASIVTPPAPASESPVAPAAMAPAPQAQDGSTLSPQAGMTGDAAAPDAASAVELSPFAQAVARAAGDDKVLQTFYRDRDYKPLWIGDADVERRAAFLTALADAPDQGLPAVRYDRDGLIAKFRDVRTERDLGALEVAMSKTFLLYARDVQTGVLEPRRVDPGIVRDVPRRDPAVLLTGFAAADPAAFLRSLPPQNAEYARLLKTKMRLEQLIAEGGWGPEVQARALKPGQSGPAVVQLRNRLIRMGYLPVTAENSYDPAMRDAVRAFQQDHGLTVDGVADGDTIKQVNVAPSERLESVLVALERERWINMPLGKRHIWVNLADFSAKLVDDGKVTFETRAVVGQAGKDRQTPEFSDHVEFMVINPSWYVPRSIVVKEYLPAMQRNPNADPQLTLMDNSGRTIPRGAVNFNQYNAQTFPFALKQPPSDGNALGLVKFMFPNKYNIYLHDTPTKYLFKRTVRAYSHGCVRLQQPFDMAYHLLAPQSADPEREFKAALNTGKEHTLTLKEPVPVHLVYFTAIAPAEGHMNYRRDVYGRDGEIFDALQKAGVVLKGVQG